MEPKSPETVATPVNSQETPSAQPVTTPMESMPPAPSMTENIAAQATAPTDAMPLPNAQPEATPTTTPLAAPEVPTATPAPAATGGTIFDKFMGMMGFGPKTEAAPSQPEPTPVTDPNQPTS